MADAKDSKFSYNPSDDPRVRPAPTASAPLPADGTIITNYDEQQVSLHNDFSKPLPDDIVRSVSAYLGPAKPKSKYLGESEYYFQDFRLAIPVRRTVNVTAKVLWSPIMWGPKNPFLKRRPFRYDLALSAIQARDSYDRMHLLSTTPGEVFVSATDVKAGLVEFPVESRVRYHGLKYHNMEAPLAVSSDGEMIAVFERNAPDPNKGTLHISPLSDKKVGTDKTVTVRIKFSYNGEFRGVRFIPDTHEIVMLSVGDGFQLQSYLLKESQKWVPTPQMHVDFPKKSNCSLLFVDRDQRLFIANKRAVIYDLPDLGRKTTLFNFPLWEPSPKIPLENAKFLQAAEETDGGIAFYFAVPDGQQCMVGLLPFSMFR